MSERDLRRELDEYPEALPVSWKPTPGAVLIGRLLCYDTAPNPYGGTATLAIIRPDDRDDGGPVAVWLTHHVLMERFRTARPKPGERVGIRRLPDGEGGHGAYARYAVIVDRDDDGAAALDALDDPDSFPW